MGNNNIANFKIDGNDYVVIPTKVYNDTCNLLKECIEKKSDIKKDTSNSDLDFYKRFLYNFIRFKEDNPEILSLLLTILKNCTLCTDPNKKYFIMFDELSLRKTDLRKNLNILKEEGYIKIKSYSFGPQVSLSEKFSKYISKVFEEYANE